MLNSIKQASKKLNTSIKNVRRYIASKQLQSTFSNGTYKISDEAIASFSKAYFYESQKTLFPEMEISEKVVNWVDISDVFENVPISDMTFVDLFCGAGGLSKGLELAGLQGICGLDWFKEAGMTYRRNFKMSHGFVQC